MSIEDNTRCPLPVFGLNLDQQEPRDVFKDLNPAGVDGEGAFGYSQISHSAFSARGSAVCQSILLPDPSCTSLAQGHSLALCWSLEVGVIP